MSISSVTSKIVYVGTGSTAAAAKIFAYPFYILAQTDLTVTEFNVTTSAETVKVLSTDYDVSGVGVAGGGNVTITGSYTHLPTNCQLVINRVMALTQATDYVENDPFPAETHEKAIDKLTMIAQQTQEQLDRAVLADVTATASTLDVNASVAACRSSATVATEQAVLSSAYAGATTTDNPTFTGTANFTDVAITGTASIGSVSGTANFLDVSISGAVLETTSFVDVEITGIVMGTADFLTVNSTDQYITNTGGSSFLEANQSGVLAVSQPGFYIHSNAVQTSSALMRILQDHATSSANVFEVDNDGVGAGVQIDTTGSSAHIRLIGDPANTAPTDGDFWFDGTSFKVRIGSATVTLSTE